MGKSEIPPQGPPPTPPGKGKRRTTSFVALQTLPSVSSTKRPRQTPEAADMWTGSTGPGSAAAPARQTLKRSLSSRASMTGPAVPPTPPELSVAAPTPEAMAELLAADPEEFEAAIRPAAMSTTPSSQASISLPAALLAEMPALHLDTVQRREPMQQTLFVLGKKLLAQANFVAAAAQFERLVELIPQDGRAHFYLAAAQWRAASDASQRHAALQSAHRAVQANPHDDQACVQMADICLALGEPQAARYMMATVAARQPTWAVAQFGQARALFDLQRHDEALSFIDATLIRDPQHRGAWVLQGQILSHMGRHYDALKSFDAALDQQPQDEQVLSRRDAAMHAFVDWSTRTGRYRPR